MLRRLLAFVPTTGLLGLRDRAMLTIGWTAALRRSELVALDVADVTRVPKGGVVFIADSKTDQEGRGEEVPIFHSNLPEHSPGLRTRTLARTRFARDSSRRPRDAARTSTRSW